MDTESVGMAHVAQALEQNGYPKLTFDTQDSPAHMPRYHQPPEPQLQPVASITLMYKACQNSSDVFLTASTSWFVFAHTGYYASCLSDQRTRCSPKCMQWGGVQNPEKDCNSSCVEQSEFTRSMTERASASSVHW